MNRIEINPHIHFGKPCVKGARIPLEAVLELAREGLTFMEIIKDYYLNLTQQDIQTCVITNKSNLTISVINNCIKFLECAPSGALTGAAFECQVRAPDTAYLLH